MQSQYSCNYNAGSITSQTVEGKNASIKSQQNFLIKPESLLYSQ